MNSTSSLCALFLAGLASFCPLSTKTASAQGLAADYERADRLPRLVQGKVVGGAVKANWATTGDRFWYRGDRGDGKREFIVVDAVAAMAVNKALNSSNPVEELRWASFLNGPALIATPEPKLSEPKLRKKA